jgi:Tol biopolymer transport system component
MPADGGAARSLVTLDVYFAGSIAVSPDGRTALYVSNRSGDQDIWSVPLAGGEPTSFAASPVFDGDPQSSPDGSLVAFTSVRSGGTADIWVMPAGGGAARQLTDWPSNEGNPRWSPDGATITFTSSRDATQAEVWTIPTVGGQATRITRGNVSAGPARWAPDGRTLFYVGKTADGSRQLFRVPASGGTPRALTHAEGGASIGLIAVSSDGAQVAYSYFVAGLAYLEVVPAAGGASRRFHTDSTRAYQVGADWSPDGARIVAGDWNYESNHINLMTVSFPQGVVRRLTTTTDAFEGDVHWTPDGRTLVFTSNRSTTRVMSANVSRLLAVARP